MVRSRSWIFTCDRHGCPQQLIVKVERAHWNFQPHQEAENRGWFITDKLVLCPDHDITLIPS